MSCVHDKSALYLTMHLHVECLMERRNRELHNANSYRGEAFYRVGQKEIPFRKIEEVKSSFGKNHQIGECLFSLAGWFQVQMKTPIQNSEEFCQVINTMEKEKNEESKAAFHRYIITYRIHLFRIE